MSDETTFVLGAEKPVPADSIRRYDFRNPPRFGWDQMRTLRNLADDLGKRLSARLSAHLRTAVDAVREETVALSFFDWTENLPEGAQTLAIARFSPSKGNVLLRVDAVATDAILERRFGGDAATADGTRAASGMTSVEVAEMERACVLALDCVRETWSFVRGLAPSLTLMETDPRFAVIVPPGETTVLSSFRLSIGSASGQLDLVMPWLTLAPFAPMLTRKYWYGSARRDGTPGRPTAIRARMPLELACDGPRMSVGSLRALRKGARIPLESLDAGRSWLSLGGARVAELSDTSFSRGHWSANAASSRKKAPEAEGAEDVRSSIDSTRASLEAGMRALEEKIEALRADREAAIDAAVFGAADQARSSRPFGSVAAARAEALASALAPERDQVVALALCYLDDIKGARTLESFPVDRAAEILRRIARIDVVSRETIETTEAVLARSIADSTIERLESGGVARAGALLGAAAASVERVVSARLAALDGPLADAIAGATTRFADIARIDPATSGVLTSLDPRELALACRTLDATGRALVLDALPRPIAAEVAAVDASLGAVAVADAEAAASRIASELRDLLDRGMVDFGKL